jgi:hypothetical protein
MKLVNLVAAVAMVVTAGAASAGDWYGSAGFDQKVKQNSSTNEYHNVYSMVIGTKLGNGFSVEGLVENEQVERSSSGQAHEGLYQLRLNKSFDTGTIFTPYVGVAVGEKNKATIDFPIYRYDIGTTVKITEQIGAKLNWRHRQAFDSKLSNGTATKYSTDETRIGVYYKLTPVDTITVSYAQERNTDGISSEYNTTAISYSRSF